MHLREKKKCIIRTLVRIHKTFHSLNSQGKVVAISMLYPKITSLVAIVANRNLL